MPFKPKVYKNLVSPFLKHNQISMAVIQKIGTHPQKRFNLK